MPPQLPTSEQKQEALEQTIVFSLHGKEYVFRPAMVSSRDEIDYRRATGLSYSDIMGDDGEMRAGCIELQMFMWLARRQAGERELPYGALPDVTYADLAAIEWPADQKPADVGEARAAG